MKRPRESHTRIMNLALAPSKKDDTVSIHAKNLQTLMIEMFKSRRT